MLSLSSAGRGSGGVHGDGSASRATNNEREESELWHLFLSLRDFPITERLFFQNLVSRRQPASSTRSGRRAAEYSESEREESEYESENAEESERQEESGEELEAEEAAPQSEEEDEEEVPSARPSFPLFTLSSNFSRFRSRSRGGKSGKIARSARDWIRTATPLRARLPLTVVKPLSTTVTTTKPSISLCRGSIMRMVYFDGRHNMVYLTIQKSNYLRLLEKRNLRAILIRKYYFRSDVRLYDYLRF